MALRLRVRDPKVERLARHPLLTGCSAPELERVARNCDDVVLEPGNTLVREGRIGNWFFLVDEGVAELRTAGRHVGYLGPGQHIGELCMYDAGRSPWTAVANTTMRLFVIDRRAFAGLISDIPSLRRGLIAAMAGRLRDAHGAVVWDVPDEPGMVPPAPSRSRSVGLHFAVALGALLLLGTVVRPPVVVLSPGSVTDAVVDVRIEGVPTTPISGHYLVATVKADRPNGFGYLGALIRNDAGIVPHRPGATGDDGDAFALSRAAAAVAAARASGLDAEGDLPFRLELRGRGLRGPSAGLAYALVIADLLDGTDLAAGRTIAATGSIDEDGRIGRVGGVAQKAIGAGRAGATLLLVPRGQGADAGGPGIDVREVGSLAEAIALLRGTDGARSTLSG